MISNSSIVISLLEVILMSSPRAPCRSVSIKRGVLTALAQENDLSDIRLVPPRIVEEYLYEEEDDPDVEDDEDNDIEIGDDDGENPVDCEIGGDEVESA